MPPKAPLNWGLLPPTFLLPSSTRSLLPLIPLTNPISTTIRTIRSTNTPRPDRFAHDPRKPALGGTSTSALARKAVTTPLRTGLIAIKRGMTGIYDSETGKRTPCTVLQLDRNEVVAHKTRTKNGYWAVQMGAGSKQAYNVSRPMLGHFAEAGVAPKRWVFEFKVKDKDGLGVGVGEEVGAGWFSVGQFVDVRGVSRGMGFAGGMKRHGFSGQPASHGQSLMHRGMGSAGGSQGSGSRVLPGKRMAGNMGNENVTVKNLRVLQIDDVNGIVVVHGCVPGPKNSILRVQDAMGKPWPAGPMAVAEIVKSAVGVEPEVLEAVEKAGKEGAVAA
ncbi:mitochondrial 54S ribosomal protein YmL9 [Dendryphion nanum]|uniref:Large ribosomal subunit protein uL3m n=1 Tax=Dendryphion nanum TaxID=256645 RepID=A0A9P9DU42_9PLEO|nr:mitochondrial 54S ribosomal protein YmL9 [Dendryphion nanum]